MIKSTTISINDDQILTIINLPSHNISHKMRNIYQIIIIIDEKGKKDKLTKLFIN